MKRSGDIAKQFIDVCCQMLEPLEREFGLRPVHSDQSSIDGSVIYQNATTGVVAHLDIREAFVSVSLYRLVEGKLPEDALRAERSSDPNNGFDLGDLIMLRNPSLNADQPWEFPLTETRMRQALEGYVRALRECAEDVLRGDFQVFEELRGMREQAIAGAHEETLRIIARHRKQRTGVCSSPSKKTSGP